MGDVGAVNFQQIRQIINQTDPRPEVAKIIEVLHKDIAQIDKQMVKATIEEKQKLAKT